MRIRKIVATLLVAAGIASCGGSSTESSDTTAAASESAVKVALVMSGSINDGGWNQSAYEGLALLDTAGVETKYTENVQQADITSAVEGYAKDGFSLVIGHGYEFGAAIAELAPNYPNTKFFATTFTPDASMSLGSNIAYVDPQYYKAAYSTGALAAMLSTSGTVGVVGGGDNPTQATMIKAFKAGAASVNSVKGLDVLTGDYDDPQKGKEAALAMIGQGADVIAHFANTTGLGAIEAAIEKNVKVIGFYNDQLDVAPALLATSFKIELAKMVEFLGLAVKDGTFPGGTQWSPDLTFMWKPVAGGSDHNSTVIDDSKWAEFLSINEKVNAGEIEVPTS